MIPILYESTETTFASNGIGRLADCTSCTVTEERNGIFECTFTYPITGRLYSEILIGRIVSVIHDDTKARQPFVIYRFTAPINGLVTFNAHHISYELSNVILSPFTATSVADALAAFVSHSTPANRFTFWTDKTTTANFAVKFPKAVRDALGGSEGSILDVYGGGEYKFDKFDVKLYAHRGNDSGVVIRYGKNLIDIENELDISESYNAAAPYWKDDTTVVMLPEVIITQADLDPSAQIVAAPMDLSEEFDDAPTVSQLRTRATAKFNKNKPWEPSHTITVDFVSLWQTDEYKDFSALQRVGLCDTVTVFYPEMGVNVTEKVIRTVYDVLTEKFDQIELGTTPTNLYNKMAAVAEDAVRDLPSKGFLDAAIAHATELITGGLGGHVVFTLNADGEPEEILIMDTDDTSTAVNVWRFNQGGLGHSHSGYAGPYDDVALTMDGKINASMITAGVMNANLITAGTMAADRIRTGLLQSENGVTSWNLNTGELSGALEIIKDDLHVQVDSVTYPVINLTSGDYSEVTDDGFEILTVGGTGYDDSRNAWLIHKYSTGHFAELFNVQERFFRESAGADFNFNSAITSRYFDVSIEHVQSDNSYIHIYRRGSGFEDRCYYPDTSSLTNSQRIAYDYRHSVKGLFYTAGADMADGETIFESSRGQASQSLSSIITGLSGSYDGPWTRIIATDRSSSTIYEQVAVGVFKNLFVVTGTIQGTTKKMLSLAPDSSCIITSSAATINGNTVAYQSPSSIRYKEQIRPIEKKELDPHRLYSLPVVQFVYKNDAVIPYADTAGKTIPGFIAEDVEAFYPSAVIHDEEGRAESWDERRIIPGMLALIQEQKTKIDELEARIARLEALVMSK